MSDVSRAAQRAPLPYGEPDQRVILHGVSWDQFEALLAIRGDHGGVRMTYLEGELELMSPSIDHEGIKTLIARLLEAWALERGVPLSGYGSWTVKSVPQRRGVEPDECYVVGTHRPAAPDLAIEVIWTHGGLDKMDVYRGLGVRELWVWQGAGIEVHALRGDRYQRVERSTVLPDLDLDLLADHLDPGDQPGSVRAFVDALREQKG